jgi:hypothetical protein
MKRWQKAWKTVEQTWHSFRDGCQHTSSQAASVTPCHAMK